MNLFFSLLSAAYILVIFWWADSPAVSRFDILNPFSLLHIPLYAVLTILLLLAVGSEPRENSKIRYTLAAFMAIAVGILDEYHQSFIPTRDASLTDVFINLIGVFLGLFIFHRLPLSFWAKVSMKLKKVGIHFPSLDEEDMKLERRR